MLKAVIIDDHYEARFVLKSHVESFCFNVNIIGEADSVKSGAKLIAQTQPDLVFLDIELGDGSGFDILEILPHLNFKVIFTTGNDGHAIKAFRFSAVDYLLKPIDSEQLTESVSRAVNTVCRENENLKNLAKEIKHKKEITRISIPTQNKIILADIKDIIHCEADVNYTTIHLNSGEKYLVSKTLKEYDELLSEYGFIRPHQSHLVNLQFIKEFVKEDGCYLVLKNRSHIPVSTRNRNKITEMLKL
ncbi:MAG: LytR/AlgR family response regulator transcription factor [Flavobacteriales bacterium]